MLSVAGLSFRHHRDGPDILRDVAVTIPEGRITAILGPNGSGKTTLFKCIAGLWKPRAGEIRCDGEDLTQLSGRRRAALVAVVPQDHEPPFPYAVEEVVLTGRTARVELFASPSRADREAAAQAMEQAGIAHLRGRSYTKISGGERQLVLIARALAQETPVLILDEPTAHLDFRHQFAILTKVRQIVRDRGLTVLMTLHDPNLTMQFADRVGLIREGRLIAEGAPRDVLTRENLGRLYDMAVTVVSYNGTGIIVPEAAP